MTETGVSAQQPKEDERYLVTYRHLAPLPKERLTIGYTTNKLIRTLQNGDLILGVPGLNVNRHICADVLARETTPIQIDTEFLVRLFDTADAGFATNEIRNTISALFTGKKLGEGVRISDISSAVNALPDVESVKLDPFQKLGRTDTPTFLKIFMTDGKNFRVKPGFVEGVVTFYTHTRPTSLVLIPSNTIVSNEFNFSSVIQLFETTGTFRAPLETLDSYYVPAKDRYEFKIPVKALFENAATINRKQISVVGGQLKTQFSVENEDIIEGAVVVKEVSTGNGTFTLTPKNGQLIELTGVWNFSAIAVETPPPNSNYIKLKHGFITNRKGDNGGKINDSSLIFDDPVVFINEVDNPPKAPGDFQVSYTEGWIRTFTKTPADTRHNEIRYTYAEIYNTVNSVVSADRSSVTLYAPSNAGKPVPQKGDTVYISYRWKGNGVPLNYRIETFSNPKGILDLSFISATEFSGPIFINNRQEQINNVKTHPEPPFYAFDPLTKQLSIVGRELIGNEEIYFRFTTPFGDMDLAFTAYDLQSHDNVSRFTFNVDFQTMRIVDIEFLEMGGESVKKSPGMIINAGLPKTKEKQIVIQLAAVNAVSMMFSEDQLFRDKTDLDFEPFSTAKLFTLSDGDGLKTVYGKIRFANTGISDVIVQSSIILDSLFNEGQYIPLDATDFNYDAREGLLRIPTSFGQSDIVLNATQSVSLANINLFIDTQRVKRNF